MIIKKKVNVEYFGINNQKTVNFTHYFLKKFEIDNPNSLNRDLCPKEEAGVA